MTAPIRLWWLNEAALQALQARLDGVVQAWARGWGLTPPAPGTVCRLPQDWTAASTPAAVPCGLAVLAPPDLDKRIMKAVFGASCQSDIAEAAASQALTALVQAVKADLAADALALPPSGLPGDRGAIYAVAIGTAEFGVVVPVAWWTASGTETPERPPHLPDWSPPAVMAAVAVDLGAVLGSADLSVSELMNLEPDDVVVLDQFLHRPLRVRAVHDNVHIHMHAVLGQRQARRAVRFVASSLEKES